MDLKNLDIKAELVIDKDLLSVRLIGMPHLPENIEYAYYLFSNRKRIQTKWYSKDQKVTFKLVDAGTYHVACFIKKVDALQPTVIIESENCKYIPEVGVQFQRSLPISIFGSCVSRDLFEYDAEDIFSLKTYIARQSIISAVSPGIDFNFEQLRMDSEFQRKQVYNDITKGTFANLIADNSEYLIIDLIEERFPLAKYGKSYVTYSNEMASSGFFNREKAVKKSDKIKGIFRNSYYINKKDIKYFIDIFCSRISEIYPQDKIIIHRAIMLDNYVCADGTTKQFPLNHLKNNLKINAMLNYMYDYMIDKFPNANLIDLCSNYYAAEDHKWGLAPMHYQEEYYFAAMDELRKKLMKA